MANKFANQIFRNRYDVLDIVDSIYQEEDSETLDKLDGITDDLKTWVQQKSEPPDYLMSIIDKIKKN
jgi:hypothetical protein